MEFENKSAFPALAYQGLDRHDQEFHVVALRATLDILDDYSLDVAEDQGDLLCEDEYFGGMNASSVRQENDLVPFKPKCDVIVNATAHAPGGKPVPAFDVAVSIHGGGQTVLHKTLRVTGPRFWINKLAVGWSLGEPEPFLSLPLRYEYAYGGENILALGHPAVKGVSRERLLSPEQRQQHPLGSEQAPAAHTAHEHNPVGSGFLEPWYRKALFDHHTAEQLQAHAALPFAERMLWHPAMYPAPRIESPAEPILDIEKHYAPQGFGAIAKPWLPRRTLAGTYDQAFFDSGKWLPEDFDFGFWNGAHPDMQIPYLHGDETIELTNLFADSPTVTLRLPGFAGRLVARFEDGRVTFRDFHIDTLVLDTEERTISLVYRCVLAKDPDLERLEAHIFSAHEARQLDRIRGAVNKELEQTLGGA